VGLRVDRPTERMSTPARRCVETDDDNMTGFFASARPGEDRRHSPQTTKTTTCRYVATEESTSPLRSTGASAFWRGAEVLRAAQRSTCTCCTSRYVLSPAGRFWAELMNRPSGNGPAVSAPGDRTGGRRRFCERINRTKGAISGRVGQRGCRVIDIGSYCTKARLQQHDTWIFRRGRWSEWRQCDGACAGCRRRDRRPGVV